MSDSHGQWFDPADRCSPLEPAPEERLQLLGRLVDVIEAHTAGIRELPVSPTEEPSTLRAAIESYDFQLPREPAATLEEVAGWLRRGIVHTSHPRYFGLFNPRPAFMGILGDALAAAFNPQLAAATHAPAAVEVERHLVRYMAERLGFHADSIVGSFTTGGAEANLSAVLVALTRTFPDVVEQGLRAVEGQPVFYASTESHLAWLKIAQATGLGRDAVRLVAVEPDLKLSMTALRAQVAEDRGRGLLPFMVVATAGTTSSGTIDPLGPIADVCQDEQLHFHVDAAWAGAVALSEQLKGAIAGIERADSVTVDAHKWLSAPMGAGMFLCGDEQALRRTFDVSTAYMPAPSADAPDPYVNSIQWSRRFIGLKVFLALAVAGQSGYAAQIEGDCQRAKLLRGLLETSGWHIVNETPLPVVCFVDALQPVDAELHQRLCSSLVASGRAWLSVTRVRGETVLRTCITSFLTDDADVRGLVADLNDARDEAMATS